MKQVFQDVEPIRIGYDSGDALSIVYDADFYEALALATGRLVAQFRASANDASVIFEADSDDDTIERNGETGLLIRVPATATALMAPGIVVFDLVRIGDERRVIPGTWSWPVVRTVTRDVQ